MKHFDNTRHAETDRVVHLQWPLARPWLQVISAFVFGLLPGIGPSAGHALRYRIRLTGAHAMPGRLGGGVAAPRCCAALALTHPPPANGLYASTRYPAGTATLTCTLIEIRVFVAGYHTYRFAYLSFAYPPHIINSRIYDVGINCHKYVKYVDSRTALLWPRVCS